MNHLQPHALQFTCRLGPLEKLPEFLIAISHASKHKEKESQEMSH